MKKYIIIIFALLCITSCIKEEVENTKPVKSSTDHGRIQIISAQQVSESGALNSGSTLTGKFK